MLGSSKIRPLIVLMFPSRYVYSSVAPASAIASSSEASWS